jgi:hypothetical protein
VLPQARIKEIALQPPRAELTHIEIFLFLPLRQTSQLPDAD